MKILHVIESLDDGGAERVLLDIVRHAPEGVGHLILCLSTSGALADEAARLGVRPESLSKRPGFDPGLVRRLRDRIRSASADIVHTHLFTGNLWGRLALRSRETPVVMSVQNLDSWIRGWRALAERWLAGVPAMTVVVSASALEERRRFGIDPDRARVIHNGSSRSCREDLRAERRGRWGVGEHDVVIGVLARCVPQKDPDLFMSIAASVRGRCPHSRFIWVGDGEGIGRLDGGKVGKPGHDPEPMGSLAGFDIQLSTSRREGFSLSLLEGMRSGLPVVATDVPGNRDLLGDVSEAVLFDPAKPEDAVEAIVRMIEDAGERHRRGEGLRVIAERRHTAEAMAARYHEVYREVIGA